MEWNGIDVIINTPPTSRVHDCQHKPVAVTTVLVDATNLRHQPVWYFKFDLGGLAPVTLGAEGLGRRVRAT